MEPAHIPQIKVFVSSPGDVAEERVIARRLLDRLAERYRQIARLEAVFWEHEPLLATDTFQSQIVLPAETDIVVCMLWARLGTRLPSSIKRPDGSTYASGTEFEFENAVEAHRQRGVPDLVVYRKTVDPIVRLDDEKKVLERLDQKRALDAFIDRWFHGEDGTLVAAFHPFADSGEFEELLEIHLEKLIKHRLEQLHVSFANSAAPEASWTAGSPFRGLEVFDVEHAPVFFGRTRAVSEVLDSMRRQASVGPAFLLLLGMSGCGKSSLVRAGILPMLMQPGVIQGVGLWRRAIMRPSDATGDLFQALATALLGREALPELASDGTTADELAQLMRDNPNGANLLVKGALSQAAAAIKAADEHVQPEARLVFVLDQMEEIFTLEAISARDRTLFFDAIVALATSGRVWVIATMRSDLYHRCAEIPQLATLREQYNVVPPTPSELGQMIRQPANAAGLRFEEDPQSHECLDDLLRDAAAGDPASLPLLEFTLEELYKRRRNDGMLTLDAYRQLGGVMGALATRADEVFQSLDVNVRRSLPRVFRMLVTVSMESGLATRRTAPLKELRAQPQTGSLVDAFIEARLVTADQLQDGTPVARVTHEALLTEWLPLQEWLVSDRELLLIRSRVTAAAQRWDEENRRADMLLSAGKPLEEAVQLRNAGEFGLRDRDVAFIEASAARARSHRRLKQMVIAGLLALTILAVTGGIVANHMRGRAEHALLLSLQAHLDCSAPQVPEMLKQFRENRALGLPLLRRVFADTAAPPPRRLRAAMALAHLEGPQGDLAQQISAFLVQQLKNLRPETQPRDSLPPDEIRNFQQCLDDEVCGLELVHRLEQELRSPDTETTMGTIICSLLISRGHFDSVGRWISPTARGLSHTEGDLGNSDRRTVFIHEFHQWLGDQEAFVEQFKALTNGAQVGNLQAAVCLALKFIDRRRLRPKIADEIEGWLNHLYLDSPRADVHAAVYSCLKQWTPESVARIKTPHKPDREWYELAIGTGNEKYSLSMARIPGGTLVRYDKNRDAQGNPIRNEIDVPALWVSATEVTVGVYREYVNDKNLEWDVESANAALPASMISWCDSLEFCNWLTERERREGLDIEPCYSMVKLDEGGECWSCDFSKNGYRLPLEAEWEWACRAHSADSFCFGDSKQRLKQYGWTKPDELHAVAEKCPNAFGLFDLHGNLYEWCWEVYDSYPEIDQEIGLKSSFDHFNHATGDFAYQRPVRGGASVFDADQAQSGYRERYPYSERLAHLGIRVVRTSDRSYYPDAAQPSLATDCMD